MTTTAQQQVLLTHASGLHARPAVKFTQTAKGFDADVEFSADGGDEWINAKSIVKVMGARVPARTVLVIRAQGGDAEAAVDALVQLVDREFGDNDADQADHN